MILIAFRHSDSRLFARAVTLVRGGDSAHVESAVDTGPMSLCVSASFIDGGVRGKMIDLRNPSKWRVYRWVDEHVDLLKWLERHAHDGYDLRGLLGIVAQRVGHDLGRRFCSESVAEHINLPWPETYDLVRLERHVALRAQRVQWSDGQWCEFNSLGTT